MLEITYGETLLFISAAYLVARAVIWIKNKRIEISRELQLLLVYVCIAVVARLTLFPIARVDGRIAPLIFDASKLSHPRVNFVPFVHLFDYKYIRTAFINILGNTFMFIPIGFFWPILFKELRTPIKVLAAGFGFSVCIETVQLAFFERVSDVDDLILNTLGFAIGYVAFRICSELYRKRKEKTMQR